MHAFSSVKTHASNACLLDRVKFAGLFGDSGASAFFGGAASAVPLFYWEDKIMNLYESLYYKLFSVMADAVESLEQGEPIAARRALIAAMRGAEEAVVSAEA